MPGRKEDLDFLVIVKLCSLLRENGGKIICGESKFVLTTQSLGLLSTSFRRLSDVEYSDGGMTTTLSLSTQNALKWKEDVNFLRNFITRCPSLKIIHGSNTMQGAIQVQRFRNLQILEIKKVPIHMIEGLHHLRGQLQTIIVSRSLQHIQDLFETCGGDMSSPMSWPQLNTVNFSFNGLTRLDSALRLLPVLQVLDISHNSLTKTENYLEYLTELQRINLGYNMIDDIPTFSISAKCRLKTLVLKNNNLDNIQGVEELVLLEELDVADNCLSQHEYLQPLSSLVRLNQLKLNGNPLFYHSRHRRLTVKFISSLAVSAQFELDGRNLTSSEILHNNGVNVAPSRRPSAIAHSVITEPINRTRENVISKDYNFVDSDNIATSLPVASSRKKRKKPKLRANDLSDLETSTTEMDSADTSAASSPRPEYLRAAMPTLNQIELLRNHYGPDWLKVMDDRPTNDTHCDPVTSDSETNQSKSRADHQQPLDVEESAGKRPTDDDLYLIETSGSYSKPEVKKEDNHGDSGDYIKNNTEVKSKEESYDGIYGSNEASKNGISRLYSIHGEEWNRTDEEEEAFYGEECEPFIVMVESDASKQLILTLNERYLTEKDLNGCLIDKLDLKCLKNYESGETSINHGDVVDSVMLPTVHLYFDYIKKDRRIKNYVMEDSQSAQKLVGILLPYLAVQELKSVNNTLYQCLKCSNQFTSKEGIHKETCKHPSKGSSKDLLSMNVLGNVLYKCPTCGSDLVIEVGSRDVSDTGSGSASSTPYGSYTSNSFLDKKLYSPSKLGISPRPVAKSTPLKNDIDKYHPVETSTRRNILPNLSEKNTKQSVIQVSSGKGDNPIDLSIEVRRRSNAFISQGDFILGKSDFPEANISESQLSTKPSESMVDISSDKSRTRLPSESDIMILHTSSDHSLSLTSNHSADSFSNHIDKHIPRTSDSVNICSDGDITVTNNESPNKKSVKGEVTPLGSPLSVNVCSDMVSSVYLSSTAGDPDELNPSIEKTSTSDISVLFDDSQENAVDNIYDISTEKSLSSIEDDIVKVDYSRDPSIVSIPETDDSSSYKILNLCDSSDNYTSSTSVKDDFGEIDHRLKLHLMMSLFENTEEFKSIIETDVCQYLVPEDYHAFVILSSDKFYLLKITSEKRSEPPANWLKCLDIQPVTELFHVDMGLGYQSLRLEFGTDCSSYTLIIRDERRCKNYLHFLEELLKNEDFLSHHQMKTFFVKEVLPSTMKQLQTCVLAKRNGEERILVAYLLGYLVRGMNTKYPVSFVITDDELILVKENHQWPQPRLQAPLDKNTTANHLTVLERHKITNIVTVETFSDIDTKLCLTLHDEESGGESTWNVTMETQNGVELFIAGIRTPWEAEFGVELDVSYGIFNECLEES